MEFSYLEVRTSQASIDIEDIGNCCLQAFTDEGDEHIIIVSTSMGTTTITQFGPLLADSEEDTGGYFSYLRYNFEYNQSKVYKTIDKFLNSGKGSAITQVFEISKEEAYNRLNIVKL